jgi:hypothetical protein
MVYALFENECIVACYSKYLSLRDAEAMKKLFACMPVEVDRIQFKTLEELAQD